jgi:cytochrome c-type biogenesis protein CcmE
VIGSVNKRAKQRLIGVTILIFVAIGALIGLTRLGNATATPVTIADVVSDASLAGKQIEVTGQVVAGSWISGAKPFVFEIEDTEAGDDERVRIVWDDVVPGSFGDGTTATVTGTIAEDGSVEAKYLVTKCPSKYESATGALTVNDVINRAAELSGSATIKVTGFVVKGSIQEAGAPVRFQIADDNTGATAIDIAFGGGLPDEFTDGVKVVLTGSVEDDGVFQCAEVALDEAAQ